MVTRRLAFTTGCAAVLLGSAAALLSGPPLLALGAVLLGILLLAHAHRTAYHHLPAARDDLTGLPGRNLLIEQMSEELRALSRSDASVAALFVDLDGFKALNDELGHRQGDRALVEAGRSLRTSVRPGDMVARLGGDEFVVVLRISGACPDSVRPVVEHVARRLREQLAATTSRVIGRELLASVGGAWTSSPATSWEELVAAADQLMYAAKDGPGICIAHDPVHQAPHIETPEADLRRRRTDA